MKKKIIITITIIILIIVAVLGFILITKKQEPKQTENQESYNIIQKETLKACRDSTCIMRRDIIFDEIKYDTDKKEINKIVDKINKDTDKYYKMIKNSNLNAKECETVKDKYNYRKRIDTDYNSYTNKDYITISVKRIITDVCTNKVQDQQVESYIFDRKQNKMLSQKEFRNKIKLTNKQIDIIIKGNDNYLKLRRGLKLSPENAYRNGKRDIKLFYNTAGDLLLSYYQSETDSYYTVLVNSLQKD